MKMDMNFKVLKESRYLELLEVEKAFRESREDNRELQAKLYDSKRYASHMEGYADRLENSLKSAKSKVDSLIEENYQLKRTVDTLEDTVDELRKQPKSSLEEELVKVFTKAMERNGVGF